MSPTLLKQNIVYSHYSSIFASVAKVENGDEIRKKSVLPTLGNNENDICSEFNSEFPVNKSIKSIKHSF